MPRQFRQEVVSTPAAPSAIGPYSQGVIAGDLLLLSGQLPVDPKTGEFPQGGIREQARQVFKNMKAVIEAAGADLTRVVKTTVFLTDMNDFAALNEVYAQYFNKFLPARSTVQVAALPKNAKVEVEAIVYLPQA